MGLLASRPDRRTAGRGLCMPSANIRQLRPPPGEKKKRPSSRASWVELETSEPTPFARDFQEEKVSFASLSLSLWDTCENIRGDEMRLDLYVGRSNPWIPEPQLLIFPPRKSVPMWP